MDYIRSFDIRLEKDVYYPGEVFAGHVVLENVENIKIKGIRALLRGKAHAEWKVMKSGERRTVKDDQYLLDEKMLIWGKDKHDDLGSVPILPRGLHQFPFKFTLPQSALPCSFESKTGTIRYCIKICIDIPYASSPQGYKYFTIIGPHIDCMDEKYLSPMVGQDKRTACCLCCQRGPWGLQVTLERTAYVCGENIRLKSQVENQSDQYSSIKIRLVQFVEYYLDKGVLGENKHLSYTVLEHRSPRIPPFSQRKYDSNTDQPIKLAVVPPTTIGVCRLIQIYYVLRVSLELEKSGEDLTMEFPFTVATVPFRIPNTNAQTAIEYEPCSSHVEGGMYISPEFQIGQVYDGTATDDENILLYRPLYVRIAKECLLENKAGLPGEVDGKVDLNNVANLSLNDDNEEVGADIPLTARTELPLSQREQVSGRSETNASKSLVSSNKEPTARVSLVSRNLQKLSHDESARGAFSTNDKHASKTRQACKQDTHVDTRVQVHHCNSDPSPVVDAAPVI